MSSKVIEQLKEDKNYYGELGGKYLSNSDIIDLLNYKFREKKKDSRHVVWKILSHIVVRARENRYLSCIGFIYQDN